MSQVRVVFKSSFSCEDPECTWVASNPVALKLHYKVHHPEMQITLDIAGHAAPDIVDWKHKRTKQLPQYKLGKWTDNEIA